MASETVTAGQQQAKKTWDEILDALNGQTYTLDGVHGTIKVERNPSGLHGGLPILKVTHEPSARGKRSEAYLRVKRQLHDDYDTDLTWSERLPQIATEKGLVA